MNKVFVDDSLEHWNYWIQADRKKAQRIYDLLKYIERNGAGKGKGKPERLMHRPLWSRRIDETNRLVYDVSENNIYVYSCKGHYED